MLIDCKFKHFFSFPLFFFNFFSLLPPFLYQEPTKRRKKEELKN